MEHKEYITDATDIVHILVLHHGPLMNIISQECRFCSG